MARQRPLAEILADDTGRIRPEVADLLMEDNPAPPDLHPHQGHREILQEVPWESFSHTILFFLGLLLFSVFCLWIISYRLSSMAAMEEKQVSNSATQAEETPGQTITKTEVPPVFNQEKIENEVNQVTASKKLEEERTKPTGIEEPSSFNHNQCGIRKEPFSPAINREEIEKPESKEMNTAPNVKEESESTKQSYQYNAPVRPPRYRYSENSGNFTPRQQHGYPYIPYGQAYYAPLIIRYRIITYPKPNFAMPVMGRHYIVIFQRRYR